MNQALAFELLLFEQENSLRILVAEDDADLRRLLAVALRRDGHAVIEARDTAELLEALASTLIEPVASPFDVVICEQTLPGIPGLTSAGGAAVAPARDAVHPGQRSGGGPRARRRLGAAVVDHLDVQAIRAAVRRAAAIGPAND